VFVWLTETAAPSDFLFVVCYTNLLTYLRTYFTAEASCLTLVSGTYVAIVVNGTEWPT